MIKFFMYRCLVLCSVAGASVMCTRPANSVKVDCASNQTKDQATGKCVASKSSTQRDPFAATGSNWASPGTEADVPKQAPIQTEVTGEKASDKPQVNSTPNETPDLIKAVSQAIDAIKTNQPNSTFYIRAAASSSGAYGLNLRTTQADIKNLSVAYPANSESFSASSGLLLRANISWEQGGKKCHLESTSFAISEYLREKPVSAVCQ